MMVSLSVKVGHGYEAEGKVADNFDREERPQSTAILV